MRRLALGLAALGLAACGPEPATLPDSGACLPGEGRCEDGVFQRCEDGAFTDVRDCGGPNLCAALRGCLACDPSMAKTCFGDSEVHRCDDGVIGELVELCTDAVCEAGGCQRHCALGAELIYLVDSGGMLLSFNPLGGAFEINVIGPLACDTGMPWSGWPAPATPFSMSVDRAARAWVLFTDGRIYRAETTTSACTVTGFARGEDGYELFGMGFVADAPGAETERLYIAGGDAATAASSSGNLGWIDPATLHVSTAGAYQADEYGPELTGTGDAQLYGYFPGTTSTYVARLDKSSGENLQIWPLDGLPGNPEAWAFAHWGGKFYIFVTSAGVSRVLRLDPVSGLTTTILEDLPYRIVGAGVSTCAPVVEP